MICPGLAFGVEVMTTSAIAQGDSVSVIVLLRGYITCIRVDSWHKGIACLYPSFRGRQKTFSSFISYDIYVVLRLDFLAVYRWFHYKITSLAVVARKMIEVFSIRLVFTAGAEGNTDTKSARCDTGTREEATCIGRSLAWLSKALLHVLLACLNRDRILLSPC